MTDITVSGASASASPRASGLYRAVWKWHFFAALFVLPFMAMLSLTGGIYLFDRQIEEVIYQDRLNVTPAGEAASFEAQSALVEAELDGGRIRSFLLPADETRATVFEVQDADRVRSYVWVSPHGPTILATEERDSTLMRMVRKFHGELLLGSTGTKVVELAAHWTVVLLITGVYLWWPRGSRSLARALWPDFPHKGRAFWRDIHRTVGIFAALLITPILISGLPWTDVWGGGLSQVQNLTNQESPSRAFGGAPIRSSANEGAPIGVEAALAMAATQGVAGPIEVRPPRGADGVYFIRSRQDVPMERVEVHIDQYSGTVLSRVGFEDYPTLAALISGGIAFHEGRLYGTLNLVQNLIAATLGVLLAVSGFVAWWMRRPKGSLGVPQVPERFSVSWGLGVLIAVLAILFPLMGASLILVLLLDWLIFRHLGWFEPAERHSSSAP